MTAPVKTSKLPTSQYCFIGSLNLHTYNAERTQCIWCGPDSLATKPGHWVKVTDEAGDYTAWSVEEGQ